MTDILIIGSTALILIILIIMLIHLRPKRFESIIREEFTPLRDSLITQQGKIEDLPEKSPDVSEERRGPRVGSPEKAIEGFLRGAGLSSVDEAEIVTDQKKGDFYHIYISCALH